MTTFMRTIEEHYKLIAEAFEKGFYTAFTVDGEEQHVLFGIPIFIGDSGIIVIDFELNKSMNVLSYSKKTILYEEIIRVESPYPTTQEWKKAVSSFVNTKKNIDNVNVEITNPFLQFDYKSISDISFVNADNSSDNEFEEGEIIEDVNASDEELEQYNKNNDVAKALKIPLKPLKRKK